MDFNRQPVLEDDHVLITPLMEEHFDQLYEVARDPILWIHHPISNGYEAETFKVFFRKAIEIGSLLIVDKITSKAIGSTRFYNYSKDESSVVIGQTFYAKAYWGTGYNTRVKALMLKYAFNFVQKIIFLVIINNFRSRKAIEKLGAVTQKEMTWEVDGRKLKCVVYELIKNVS
ncbi:MAG: GNAT family N-acetyltransferase [Bacteroidota bacterium]